MKPQCRDLLAYLRVHPDGATSKDVWLDLGISRLAARIDDLKRAGFVIEAELISVQSGERTVRVARYRLRETVQLGLAL